MLPASDIGNSERHPCNSASRQTKPRSPRRRKDHRIPRPLDPRPLPFHLRFPLSPSHDAPRRLTLELPCVSASSHALLTLAPFKFASFSTWTLDVLHVCATGLSYATVIVALDGPISNNLAPGRFFAALLAHLPGDIALCGSALP
jgi:hypothetical protein